MKQASVVTNTGLEKKEAGDRNYLKKQSSSIDIRLHKWGGKNLSLLQYRSPY